MSEQEQRRVFCKNLNDLLHEHNKTQREVADAISVSPQTFNTWVKGIALPRMGKVQALADYFHVPKSALLEEHSSEEGYYVDPETARIAQEVFDDPELHVLFDAAKDASPEDIRKAADYLRLAKQMTLNQNDEGC